MLLNGVLVEGFCTADMYHFLHEWNRKYFYASQKALPLLKKNPVFFVFNNNLLLKLCKYATPICINLENTNPLMFLFHFKIPFQANILLKWKFNIQRRACSVMYCYTASLQITIFNTKYLLEYVTSLSGLFHFNSFQTVFFLFSWMKRNYLNRLLARNPEGTVFIIRKSPRRNYFYKKRTSTPSLGIKKQLFLLHMDSIR